MALYLQIETCFVHCIFVKKKFQAEEVSFYDQYIEVLGDIKSIISDEKAFGNIDTLGIVAIKAQDEFKKSRDKMMNAVGKKVDKTNSDGHRLIQNAAPGVSGTSIMEKDLAVMNDLWNSLKSAIADRQRKQHEKSTNPL